MRYYEKVDEVTNNYEYVNSQYENHNNGKFEFREMIQARYIQSSNCVLGGNPLVEALPPSRTLENVIESIENIIPFSVEERKNSAIERMDGVLRLNELFIFQTQHMNLANKLDRAIRYGYTGRHIPTKKILKDLGLKRDDLQYIEFDSENECNIPSGIIKEDLSIPQGFVIVGASGSGKTKTIKRLLLNYPRLIIHQDYEGEKILFKQVPWIKIEGTYNRSLKGIGLSFFKELDKILGTIYFSKFKSIAIDEQIEKMKELSITHQIGLFVFDEVQYINQNSRKEVANYLNKLHNELPIPIVYIGTYALYTWMQDTSYTLVRRMEGSGLEEWMRMKNDCEFKRFLKELWHYQWIKNPSALTDDMVQTFYENTMGITERVIRLFQLCQINAIEMESETITLASIKEASMLMPFTSEIVKAMKVNDYSELEKLDGMIKVDINSIIKVKKASVEDRELEKLKVESILTDDLIEEKHLRSELMSYALQLDFSRAMIDNAINEITKNKKKNRNLSVMKQEMVQLLFSYKSENLIDSSLVPSATAMGSTLTQRMKVQADAI